MIQSILIKDFRLFKDVKFNFGKYITLIAGRNATGKSTLLGMLGNSCELKKKDGMPILQKQFRTEFSEIFKGSPNFDTTGSNRFRINFCEHDNFNSIHDYRDFRISWQNKGERFRIIPYKKDGSINTSGKKEWPILYLGLSRLFPIGESRTDGIHTSNLNLNEQDKQWFIRNYTKILSLHEIPKEINSIKIGETDRKKGIGISTTSYDSLTNSAGQDNIGQILCAVLSFKKLKENMGQNYQGGMLLLDEIDATLHPAAQISLIDILIHECRNLNLQIVCTTHSISLLKYVCNKTRFNLKEDNEFNEIELVYFTNANRQLQMLRNPTFSMIENELLIRSSVQNGTKIKVYTEDAEARWLLMNLISKHLHRVHILDTQIGCTELLRIRKADLDYFSKTLIILDGDVDKSTMEKETKIGNFKADNVITLPGDVRPEEIFYRYILSLDHNHKFWHEGFNIGFTWDYFNEHGPTSSHYKGKDRDKYKKWFNDHIQPFDSLNLYELWANENNELVDEFENAFLEAFNNVAQKMLVPEISNLAG